MARKGLVRLLGQIKWPGLGTILLGLYTLVPDNQARIQFWLGAAKTINGRVGPLVPVLGSPLFGIALILVGLAYIALVGEKRVIAKHPIWPVLGWIVFGGIFLGFSAILLVGYTVTQMRQMGPRHLTVEQQALLKQALLAEPDLSTRLWIVSYPECFECRAYAWEFAATVNETPQQMQKVGVLPFSMLGGGMQLSTDWRGVIVGAKDPKHLDNYQTVLTKALDAAHIHYSFEPIDFLLSYRQPPVEAVVLMLAPVEG